MTIVETYVPDVGWMKLPMRAYRDRETAIKIAELDAMYYPAAEYRVTDTGSHVVIAQWVNGERF